MQGSAPCVLRCSHWNFELGIPSVMRLCIHRDTYLDGRVSHSSILLTAVALLNAFINISLWWDDTLNYLYIIHTIFMAMVVHADQV